MLFRKGMLTIGAGYAGGFFKTDPALATPDVQVHFIIFSTDRIGGNAAPVPGLHRLGLPAAAREPRHRAHQVGRSARRAGDPAALPLGAADRDVHDRAACSCCATSWGSPRCSRYVAEERAPGPERHQRRRLLAYARETGTTIFHPTSTCRMGSDTTAVVDERLRVHGFEGLRVADGSIMPTVVSGNTNAAIVMIGEKCADMILEDAKAECRRGARAA